MARVHVLENDRSDELRRILEGKRIVAAAANDAISTWNVTRTESETVTRRKHCCVLWMTAGGRKGIGTALRATPCELWCLLVT